MLKMEKYDKSFLLREDIRCFEDFEENFLGNEAVSEKEDSNNETENYAKDNILFS